MCPRRGRRINLNLRSKFVYQCSLGRDLPLALYQQKAPFTGAFVSIGTAPVVLAPDGVTPCSAFAAGRMTRRPEGSCRQPVGPPSSSRVQRRDRRTGRPRLP
jgi:hypothetical protein